LLEIVLVLAVLAVVVLVVSAPLRRVRPAPLVDSDDVAELEAAREAKYREIRDADLDHRTGKLSDTDYEVTDSTLRAEAIEILRDLDRAREHS
jgi:hypothetical protein